MDMATGSEPLAGVSVPDLGCHRAVARVSAEERVAARDRQAPEMAEDEGLAEEWS
jgi:hypothetical protein